MILTMDEAKKRMKKMGGSLDLSGCTGLTALPDGLTVGGDLDLIWCTGLTALPDGLTVGRSLYLSRCTGLTALPDGLTVGGDLDLIGCTGLTALPDGLTVGGSLYLNGCTGLTALPDGLTVGGSLFLNGCTGLTALPDGLTVGGSLFLSGCTGLDNKERNKVKRLRNGDYAPGKYLYADGILTHVRGCKTVSGYQMYIGKIPGKHVVSDGEMYAHCSTLKEGMEDIAYKRADKQGAEQYKNLTLDSVLAESDAVTMYRVITGACRQGSAAFVESLGEKRKEAYSVREMIELTRGRFGAASFEAFWKEY